MRSNPLAVRTLVVVWILAVTSASARDQDFSGHRERRVLTGTIELPPGVTSFPPSIEVSIITTEYRHTVAASRAGTFIFTEVPTMDCIIEVHSPGYEITRTEIRGWPGTHEVYVPLGAPIEDEADRIPRASPTVTVRSLQVPEKAVNLAARAQEESDKQNLKKAVEWLREAVGICPTYVDAWNNLGVTYLRMDRHQEAESAFLKALETDSKTVPALRNLGFLYVKTKRPDEALSVLTRAREAAGKKDLHIETYLGHALYGVGRYQEAEAVLKEAVKIKSDFPAALYPLALSQIRLHEYQDARETLARFLRTAEKGNETDLARSLLSRLDTLLREEEPKSAE